MGIQLYQSEPCPCYCTRAQCTVCGSGSTSLLTLCFHWLGVQYLHTCIVYQSCRLRACVASRTVCMTLLVCACMYTFPYSHCRVL